MKWLKTLLELVLKLINPKIAFGLALSIIIILFLDWLNLVSLSEFHDLLKDSLILILIFISVVPLVKLTMSKWEISKHQKEIIKRIDSLCIDELGYLANCLKKSETTFKAFQLCSNAISLTDKGIITRSSIHDPCNPNQPFTICDFVWDYLLKNKDQIIKKYEDEKQLQKAAKRQKSKRVRY